MSNITPLFRAPCPQGEEMYFEADVETPKWHPQEGNTTIVSKLQ